MTSLAQSIHDRIVTSASDRMARNIERAAEALKKAESPYNDFNRLQIMAQYLANAADAATEYRVAMNAVATGDEQGGAK